MMSARMLFWFGLFASSVGAMAAEEATGDRYSQLVSTYSDAFKLGFEQRSEVTEARFRELFASELAVAFMAGIGDAELHEFFSAAVLSRGGLPKYAYDPLPAQIHAELEQRALATSEESQRMFGLWVRWRRFDEARALAARHPGLDVELLPADLGAIPASSTSAILDYDAVPTRISVRPIVLDRGPRIVVLSHPLCGPSERAKQSIETDPLLSKHFVAHSTWVAAPESRLMAEAFAEANAAYPTLPIRPMTHLVDWPVIDEYRTPVFYFLQDGAVQAKVVGWPPEGNRDAVLSGLKKIGLAD
jgi:hypothetical protein